MRKLLPKLVGLAAALGLVVTVVVATSAPSHAAASRTKTFGFVKTVHSGPLDTCIMIKLSGKMTYTATPRVSGRVSWTDIDDRKLVNPTVTIKSFKGPRCRTVRTNKVLSSATINEYWHAKSCTINPGIQVGFPWSVGVTPTATCRNGVKNAKLGHHFSANSSTYRLSNSGRAPTFPDTVGVHRGRTCLTAYINVKAELGNNADSVDASFDVCVP